MKKLAFVALATLAFGISAHATPPTDGECIVADPTGTPLKYRSAPYGKVLGTLKNGRKVYIIEDYRYDKNGKPWVEVYPTGGGDDASLGWVYLKYLRCTMYPK